MTQTNSSLMPQKSSTRHQQWLDHMCQTGGELDHMALAETRRRLQAGQDVTVLELDGCDAPLSLRLARAGARAHWLGPDDERAILLDAAQALEVADRWMGHVRSPDAAPLDLGDTLLHQPFDLVVAHHSLHRLAYREAVAGLRQLLKSVRFGGKIYLSALGLYSDLAEGYPDAERPVRERFAPLSEAAARQTGIDAPVCLYSERDLFLMLVEAGASILKTLTTTHGNVKAVAVRV